MICVVVAVSGGVTYARVSETVGHNTELRFAENLVRSAGQVSQQVEVTGRLVLTGAVLLGQGPAFAEKVESGNLQAALDTAVSQRAIASAAVPQETGMIMYDTQGNLMFRVHEPLNRTPEPLPAHVRAAMQGTPSLRIRREQTLGLAFSAAAPVQLPGGRIVGTLELLAKIDSMFADRLAGLSGAEIAILSPGGGVISSNLDGQTPTLDELRANPAARERPTYLTIRGERHLSMVVELRTADDDTVGTVFVGVNRALIDAEQDAAQREVLTATLIALAIGALLAGGLGVLLPRPLAVLAAAARGIQRNELDTPVPLTGPRELRDLGAAMNEMRLAILEAREQLAGENAALSQRIEASDAGLSEATLELAVMHAIVTQLAQTPADAPRVAAEQLVRLGWVDAAGVGMLDADGQMMVAAERGFAPGAALAAFDVLSRELAAESRGPGAFVEDASVRPATRVLTPVGVGALAAVPLTTATAPGIVFVAARTATRFSDERRALLIAVRTEVDAAMERFALADEVEGSRRLAESVLREMQDGVIVFGVDEHCQVCNVAAGRLLGVQREQVTGRAAADWLPLPRAAFERLRRAAESGDDNRPVVVEHNRRLLAYSAGVLPDHDRGRRGLILLIRDVTDAVAAERVKQDFVSMVGHELRTPLTLIRTSIDLLTEEGAGNLSPTQSRIAEVLQHNSERLLRLINDLLDMSALDSGRMPVHPEPMPLCEVIREVLAAHRDEAAERDLTFMDELAQPDFEVWADRGRITQVLSNLLINAMKYTPPGGHITVRTALGDPFTRIEVQDDGIGIPPEEQPLLFEKFQRTSISERLSGGTGLGLAIARSIVELHGGEIWCESDGISGSTFIFTLPSQPPAGTAMGQ